MSSIGSVEQAVDRVIQDFIEKGFRAEKGHKRILAEDLARLEAECARVSAEYGCVVTADPEIRSLGGGKFQIGCKIRGGPVAHVISQIPSVS